MFVPVNFFFFPFTIMFYYFFNVFFSNRKEKKKRNQIKCPCKFRTEEIKKNTEFPSSFEKVKQALETVRTGEYLLKMGFKIFHLIELTCLVEDFGCWRGERKMRKI